MKGIQVFPAARGAAFVATPNDDDDPYDAALTALLAHATESPSMLAGLRRRVWSALQSLHSRRRDDGAELPPEYWFFSG